MPTPRRFAPMQGWPASPERVAGFTWNPRPASCGMGGQLPRNTHLLNDVVMHFESVYFVQLQRACDARQPPRNPEKPWLPLNRPR
jgi:hypothetical protein